MSAVHTIDWKTIGVITPIFTAIIVAAVWISGKIFQFGKISQRIEALDSAIEKDIKPSLSKITARIDDLYKLQASNNVTESRSPRQLNAKGEKILEESGIKAIVDENYDRILKKVNSHKPENAYRAEQCVIKAVTELGKDSKLKEKIEAGSFNTGSQPYIVLLVGAIYVRDKIFEDIGMKPEEIDKHTPAE